MISCADGLIDSLGEFGVEMDIPRFLGASVCARVG